MTSLDFFARSATSRRRRRAGAAARPTQRRARLEPLEDRRLLSVTSADHGPDEYPLAVRVDNVGDVQSALEGPSDAGSPLSLTGEESAQGCFQESFRVGVWTPEMITDVPGWAHSQQWPEWMGEFWVKGQPMDELEAVRIEELIHMPLWADPRGGYRTILQIDGGFRDVTVDEMLADLRQLDFVDFAKLESECVVKYGPNAQESIDAMTNTATPGETWFHIFDARGVTAGLSGSAEQDDTAGQASSASQPGEQVATTPTQPDRGHSWDNVHHELVELYYEYLAFIEGRGQPEDFRPSNPMMLVDGNGRVAVEFVTVGAAHPSMVEELEAIGMEGVALSPGGGGGLLPIDALDEMASLPFVHSVGPAYSVVWPSPDPGQSWGNVHHELVEVYYEYLAFIDGGGQPEDFRPSNPLMAVQNGRVPVYVGFLGPADSSKVEQLEAIGMEDVMTSPGGASGSLPLEALPELASLQFVHTVGVDYMEHGPAPAPAKSGGSLHHELVELYYEYLAFIQGGGQPQDFRPANPLMRVRNGRVSIDILTIDPVDSSVIDQLEGIGMQQISTGRVSVGGLLPIDAVDELPWLTFIHTVGPVYAVSWVGATDTQGDGAQRSDEVRASLGIDGTGVSVGVLSDSYDYLNGAADDVASGDLPDDVSVLQDWDHWLATDEGRAMLQIVHDVAPGADLLFHTAEWTENQFAAAIRELAGAGADIIVDDIIYFAEPMFMDGGVAQAVDGVVADGVVYFSAAGNSTNHSYESPFEDSGVTYYQDDFPSALGAPRFLGGVVHDFDPDEGTDLLQSFTLDVGESMRVAFQWDEPFNRWVEGKAAMTDLDIYVFDAEGTTVLDGSTYDNMYGDPVEYFYFANPEPTTTTFNLMIVQHAGSYSPGLMKYVNFRDGSDFQYFTNSSTVYGHANAAGAGAVGAAAYYDTPEFGTSPPEPEWFTSLGGTEILFDTDGNRLDTPEDRMKPDFVGPDDVNTTFFVPGRDIEPDGFPNFNGTSAAAPHAAGLAALMLEAAPAATPAGIYSALESTAVDMEDAGFDYLTGYGLVDAAEATDLIMQRFPDFDANDDPAPGDQKDDGTTDYFEASRNGDNLDIEINGSLLDPIPIASIDGFSFSGSTDGDDFQVNSLGSDFTGNVVLNGTGAGDIAYLYDSPGTDTFTAYRTSADFEMENAYLITANELPSLYAYSVNGGQDTAVLYDLEGSTDTFEGCPTVAKLYGDGFYNQADSFRWVVAYSDDQTAEDTAVLYDLEGSDDTFQAWPTDAKLYGDTFFNRAKSFRWVVAESNDQTAQDTALLYDLEGSNDTLKAYPTLAKLYDEATFFNQAESFAAVTAYSDDQTAQDTALLYDLEGSDDTFKAYPTLAKLYDGATFFNQANSFRYVTAYSDDQTAEDRALLYDDPATDDDFRAWPTLAKLYGDAFFNQAKSFRWVHAYSEGGADLARLYDSTGADTFKAWDAGGQRYEAKLYDDAESFYNMAHSFRYVKAYAEVGSGGTDVAELYDTTGDDYLLARDADPAGEDWALLRDAADEVYAVWAYGLDEIWADSGTGDDDTADVGEDLDFALHLTGDRENQL
jgi:hypothetical protein